MVFVGTAPPLLKLEKWAMGSSKFVAASFEVKEWCQPKGDMDKSRRAFILAAGAMAAGLSGATVAQAASERDIGRSGIDRSCCVSSQRLDALVAKAFPLFNEPVILPAFDTTQSVIASG